MVPSRRRICARSRAPLFHEKVAETTARPSNEIWELKRGHLITPNLCLLYPHIMNFSLVYILGAAIHKTSLRSATIAYTNELAIRERCQINVFPS